MAIAVRRALNSRGGQCQEDLSLMGKRANVTYPGMKGTIPGHGPKKAGQPLAALAHSRKPAMVASRRIRSAQRAAQARQQKRRDSR